MTSLAIFDLDRTLSTRPTYSAFLAGACLQLKPWRMALVPTLLPVAAAYGLGRIDRTTMKEAMHRVALGRRVPREDIAPIAEAFATRLVQRGIFAQAPALLEERRAAGCRLVLATAAPALYAEPLAKQLNFDDVIASRGTWTGGFLLPSILEGNCYGEAKCARLQHWLERRGLDRSAVHVEYYSDHHSDLPALEWADAPFAVNPSRKLRREAAARAWPVIDWRSAGA